MHTTPTPANRGMLHTGDVLPDGAVILEVWLTAYKVRPHGVNLRAARQGGDACEVRPFDQVHGRPEPVMPLVVLG